MDTSMKIPKKKQLMHFRWSLPVFTVVWGHPFMTSTKNDQSFDFRYPYLHHLQKWTIDLLFKNNIIRKHVTNFKTPPPPFRMEVINVWSLMVISVWTHYNYDDYKVEIGAILISFYSGTANEKNFELKKVLEYF